MSTICNIDIIKNAIKNITPIQNVSEFLKKEQIKIINNDIGKINLNIFILNPPLYIL